MPSVYIFGDTMQSKEGKFQTLLKKELRERFPNCIITKLDPNDIQGIPDLLILWNNKWATLECKRSKNASHRPNQEYYVDLMNNMSYSAFIFPENKERILNEMEQAFRT